MNCVIVIKKPQATLNIIKYYKSRHIIIKKKTEEDIKRRKKMKTLCSEYKYLSK